MNLREIRQLIQLESAQLDIVKRRLSHCHSVGARRRSARRLIPRPFFDDVDGAADEETSMAANAAAFRRWRFRPRELVDVSRVDTSTQILGRPASLPLALAPTGSTRMMHPDGEPAVARAAGRRGLPYTLSTMGNTSIEELAAAAHTAAQDEIWFQLYVMKDMAQTRDLVQRAADSGYKVLALTVDTTVTGFRTRDERNGLIMPPALTPATLARLGGRPPYWARMLSRRPLTFATFPPGHEARTVAESIGKFSSSLTWDYLAELRASWPGQLLVKGPLGAGDRPAAV